MSRKTITITEDAYERLTGAKDSDESFTDVVTRAVEALETHDGDGEHGPNTVAVTNVDEIARRTASEVEDRMTRR